jgi:hypothetical protein
LRKVKCVETGEIFESHKQACEKMNIEKQKISDVLHGWRKTAGGYHWIEL